MGNILRKPTTVSQTDFTHDTSKKYTLGAWIAPNGKFYDVPECKHYAFACEILGAKDDHWLAVTELENKGWIHISGIHVYVGENFHCTDAQYNALEKLAEITEGSLNKSINLTRFL